MQPPIFEKEKERLEVVKKIGLLDSEPDERFDAITREATKVLKVPMSTVSIIDNDREWYKSCQGLDVHEGPRNIAFCSWAMLSTEVFIVEDTLKDERFKNNPYVIGKPYIRFYAGFAIHDPLSFLPIGVFCIKDVKPRRLSIEEIATLFELAEKVQSVVTDLCQTS